MNFTKAVSLSFTDPGRAFHWRQIEIVDRDVSNLHSSWDWAGNSVKPYSSVLKTGMASEDLKGVNLITTSCYKAFFKGVLGCSASIGNCHLVKSLPHTTTSVDPNLGMRMAVLRGSFVAYFT
jgi:hypothetical protein